MHKNNDNTLHRSVFLRDITSCLARTSYRNSVRPSVRPGVSSRYRFKPTWDRDSGFYRM